MRKPLLYAVAAIIAAFSAGLAMTAYAQLVRVPNLVVAHPMMLNLNKRMTPFDPAVNGFKFVNSFKTVTGVADITTNGLCGGMVYTVLDYFSNHMTVPQQNYTPVNGTHLQSYIYGRQQTVLTNVLPKWLELHNNPFGARN